MSSFRPRGVLNKNALAQYTSALSSSGLLASAANRFGEYTITSSGTVAQLQKNQAVVDTVGRVQASNGVFYVPGYDLGIGTVATSGFNVQRPGIYQVDASIAVSGAVIETFAGAVLVDGVAASGTQSFQSADARGAASVAIHGVVHANIGQVINVGVMSLHSTLTSIGSEDLVHAPAANLRIVQLPAEELPFNG